MFEKPWTSIKRMLLTGLCLTTLLAPYESEAAPKNKNRSTRLSKKVRQDKSKGKGWILENGVRVQKYFHPRGIANISKQD